jgi:hypothetical protein
MHEFRFFNFALENNNYLSELNAKLLKAGGFSDLTELV